jgi:Concanavalin A-like lectin/glucanases superfamily
MASKQPYHGIKHGSLWANRTQSPSRLPTPMLLCDHSPMVKTQAANLSFALTLALLSACGGDENAAFDAKPSADSKSTADAAAGNTNVFDNDAATVARFEFNGNVNDQSANARNATMMGGTYIPSRFGQALRFEGTAAQTVDWSAHAARLAHPFTVEIVYSADMYEPYQKILSHDQTLEDGWYLRFGFRSFPGNNELTSTDFIPGRSMYLAMVSTDATNMNVYLNGALLGATANPVPSPPPAAQFFHDDTDGTESFKGTVEAMRISNVARTEAELQAIQSKVAPL